MLTLGTRLGEILCRTAIPRARVVATASVGQTRCLHKRVKPTFRHIPKQIKPHGGDDLPPLKNLLRSIRKKQPSPTNYIIRALEYPMDHAALIEIFPSILASLQNAKFRNNWKLIRALLPHLGRLREVVLLKRVLEIWMAKVEKRVELARVEGETLEPEKVEKWYHEFLAESAWHFSKADSWVAGQSEPLQNVAVLQYQSTVLVKHLLQTLAMLPSSSTCRLHLSAPFFEWLFVKRHLDYDLCQTLLSHALHHKIPLSTGVYSAAAMVALKEGHTSEAMALMKKREQEGVRGYIGSDDPIKEEREKVASVIANMLVAKTGSSPETLLQILEPYLSSETQPLPDASESCKDTVLYRHAWSILLSRLAREKSVTSEALLELSETMPVSCTVGHTMTCLVHGLMLRGELNKAWQILNTLADMEKNATDKKRGRYFDRVALAVGAQVCHRLHGLDAAIEYVDSWALRPWQSLPSPGQVDNSIKLDRVCLDVLLGLCKAEGAVSIAFRLWKAALPRWGVYADDSSLKVLVDGARYASQNKDMSEEEVFRERWRDMKAGFSFRRKEVEEDQFEAYDAAGFAKGPTSVLLDPPNNTWHDEHREKPWQMARSVFRKVLLGNWPGLSDVVSPLDEVEQTMMDRFSALFDGDSGITHSTPGPSSSTSPDTPLPAPHAPYTHISPSSSAFHSYIALLGYYSLPQEIPLSFAWMRSLGVKPKWKTLRLGLMYVGEAEGPRRWVKGPGGERRLVRDEEVLREWLQGWLEDDSRSLEGSEMSVPSEGDVAEFRRMFSKRNQRITAE
ncbi:hypothetical protein B9479_002807 [Cryptococcus floricola]|uniref:Uncharacterized protein n=1 Tax=Cryptococcus floricola TaxID=2591691 RepID=A0A5D3B102_9TREE|nr:hypothetical protein B9479_002807 [Cryptococcus floricola]